jgi:glycosyltransferase involved in cell wall biosynthesis
MQYSVPDLAPDVSVLVPALNEVISLQSTVDILLHHNNSDILEVLIIVCARTNPETRIMSLHLSSLYPNIVKIVEQSLLGLGDAFRTGILSAKGKYIVTMFSDLESDPKELPKMIAMAKENPGTIISASRWLKGGGFSGYGKCKLFVNFSSQLFVKIIFLSHLSDFTFGFRIYPKEVLQKINWQERKHCFVLESILKPIKLGTPIREIAARWTARSEGKSVMSWGSYGHYFLLALKILFTPSSRFLK